MKKGQIKYRPMRRWEIRECAELAAQAFHSYEYFTNYFPDPEERLDFMRKLILTEYRTNFGRADFLVGVRDGKIVAVADMRCPQYKKPSDLRYVVCGFWRVVQIKQKERVNAWLEMDQRAGEFCHRLLGGTTWYGSSLTIHPDYQGQGIGSDMLMNGMIPYMKQHGGTRMCFFTNSEKNLKFYQGLGFEVVDEQVIEYEGKKMGSWSFIRTL